MTARRRLVLLFGALALAGCAGSPRARPIPTTPAETTVADARKVLEGQWTLQSLQITGPDGRKADVDATGVLKSDQFGTLQIEYRMSDAGQDVLKGIGVTSPNPVVSTEGRVVIDVQHQQITYIGEDFERRAQQFDRELAAKRANPFAIERVRYYAFEDGLLRLSTRYDNGTEAVVSRWKRED
jgi:hypothetical protein